MIIPEFEFEATEEFEEIIQRLKNDIQNAKDENSPYTHSNRWDLEEVIHLLGDIGVIE